MDCTKWIPKLQVTIVNHTISDKFYVVNMVDTNVVFGVQWLYYLGENTMNYQFPEIRLKNLEEKPILLRGMHTYPNQVASSHNMRYILRNGDIEWTAEFSITYSKPHLNISKHPKEIEQLLSKYERVFRDLPSGIPPYRGVEHTIELEIGTQPIKMHPYRNPKRIRDDIEEAIKELLDLGLIRPSSRAIFFFSCYGKKERWNLENVH